MHGTIEFHTLNSGNYRIALLGIFNVKLCQNEFLSFLPFSITNFMSFINLESGFDHIILMYHECIEGVPFINDVSS